MNYAIGIDVGTSGTKSALYSRDGRLIASHTAEYPLSQPQNGYAEQDPADWWEAVTASLRAILGESGVSAQEVAGLGLSGQMHGLVLLDKEGEVLRPAILWCDSRTGAEAEELTRRFTREKLIAITANPAIASFTAAKILWVQKHEPEIWAKVRKILLPKDYIRYRLTGEFATEVSDASGMQLLDIAGRCWSPEILEGLSLTEGMLGKVYESAEITGRVTSEAAAQTGLAEGTLVAGGAGDNAAAAVGTGVVEDGRAFTTIGTSGVLFAHTSQMKLDPQGRVHTFCCAVPGEWHVMGVTQAAGLSMKWLRDTLCTEETVQAEQEGIDSYALLDRLAADVPIGAGKLLYLPYLMGERTPHLDPNARGVFFGLSAIHEKKHLIRAVLEGVSYSLRDCAGVLAEMGVTSSRMMACGGGAKSPLWRQMLADVYHCPVQMPESNEGASLGAAILALVAAGEYSGVQEACRAIVNPSQECCPDESRSAAYDAVYEIYRGLYPPLAESYRKLAGLGE